MLLALREAEVSQRLLATLVERMIEVIVALDGAHLKRLLRAAFDLRACEPPDVIVCSMHMEGCDAAAVLALVRQLGRPTAILFTSSDTDPRETPRGAAALLRPPFDAEAVSSFVWELAHRPLPVVTAGC